MKYNIYLSNHSDIYRGIEKQVHIIPHGCVLTSINGDDFTKAEEVWQLLNWSEYAKDKPQNVYSDICSCGSGTIIEFENGRCFVSLSFGFKEFDNLRAVQSYIEENRNNPMLFMIA